MAAGIRRFLDGLYKASGVAAAAFLIAIVILILLQIASRYFGFAFRGGSDYSGYAMAAASFLGFPYALNHGAHIRVSLLLTWLGRHRFWGEVWCYGVGAITACIFSYYACLFTWQTYKFKDVSSGLDATPLWIPQTTMAVGSVIFAICFIDNFVTLLLRGESNIKVEEIDGHATEITELAIDGSQRPT